jgi:beta-lactamase superfamily II metal-dependent hydrolase
LTPTYAERPLAAHFEAGQLSILVFGPGHGEAIVVILPDATLGVIDGCREDERDDPVRAFINEWRSTHGGRLRFVALTHPHADHYGGLGRLIDTYTNGIHQVWHTPLAGGRYADAYLQIERIRQENPDYVPGTEDFKGLARVFHAISSRTPDSIQHMQRGDYETVLFRQRMGSPWLKIECVAPFHGDLNVAQMDLLATLRRAVAEGEPANPSHDPNRTSAALLLSWGDSRVLLGGDLLCGNGVFQGWRRAAPDIEGPVQVIKVAHHASEAAQDWDLLKRLEPKLAIVTPFRHAQDNHPPRPEPLQRIAKMTKLALTAPPAWASDEDPIRAVEPRSHGRSKALQASIEPRGGHDAVCVSLDARGNIRKLLLTGRARLYR